VHTFTERQQERWLKGLAQRWEFLAARPKRNLETCRQRRRRIHALNQLGRFERDLAEIRERNPSVGALRPERLLDLPDKPVWLLMPVGAP
jgi:hypothetical protein